jgi:hypothetical protein
MAKRVANYRNQKIKKWDVARLKVEATARAAFSNPGLDLQPKSEGPAMVDGPAKARGDRQRCASRHPPDAASHHAPHVLSDAAWLLLL